MKEKKCLQSSFTHAGINKEAGRPPVMQMSSPLTELKSCVYGPDVFLHRLNSNARCYLLKCP